MTNKEKCEMLKSTIHQLYSKEGRSKSYISKLLEIDRKVLTIMIKKWSLEEPQTKRTILPSTEKFLNKYKQLIISRMDNNVTIVDIAKEIGVDRKKIYSLFKYDEDIKKAHERMANRKKDAANQKREDAKAKSRYNYDFEEFENEEWRPILGYEDYDISNYGRIRSYAQRNQTYYLLKPSSNPNNGRLYVALISTNGTRKTLQVSRLVGFTFLSESYDEKHSTINHKDGNVTNNHVSNLEWVSQADNNLHAYHKLNRTVVKGKRYKFDKILYKNKYEFNTVAAFARFLGKPEAQIRHYMSEPEKYDIKFIVYNSNNNCND